MEPVYITGHRNPDTDSIVAAISYAILKNALGERAYTAARIGEISDKTHVVLEKSNSTRRRFSTMSARRFRPQLRYPPILSAAVSVYHAWQTIASGSANVPVLPVTDGEGISSAC